MSTVHTVEDFTPYQIVGFHNATDAPITKGLKHTLQVPPALVKRHLWIASGSYRQTVDADEWFLQGELKFFMGGQHRGSLLFCDASQSIAPGTRPLQIRTVLRSSAAVEGGQQPPLRYSEVATGAVRLWLDMPCITVTVECDRIEYHSDRFYDFTNFGSTNGFLTGLRCLSTI